MPDDVAGDVAVIAGAAVEVRLDLPYHGEDESVQEYNDGRKGLCSLKWNGQAWACPPKGYRESVELDQGQSIEVLTANDRGRVPDRAASGMNPLPCERGIMALKCRAESQDCDNGVGEGG
ncbi:MAG: hypothetical protein V3S64_06890, partial [bacterium]